MGTDYWIEPDPESGLPRHTVATVYREMILQICRDYSGLPDVRTLTLSDVRFFYEGLRKELQEHTKLS